jgi:tetratricopeptide (TPR) repeat protein
VLGEREDFVSRFSYAIALKREGRAEEAVGIFEQLIEENGSSRLYTNLGNAYVAADRRDLAKTAYLNALKQGGSVATLYNLAQIYRDELDYENGDKYFKDAQTQDKALVSEYTARHSSHFNRIVVDETLDRSEIVREALKVQAANSVKVFTNGPLTVPAGIAAALIVLFALLDGKGVALGFRCKNCGAVACEICADNTKMCGDCKGQLSEQDDASPQARVRRMLQANRQKEKHMAVIRALSFAPPGVPQIFSGRLFSGMVFLWLFAFSITLLVHDPFMTTGLAGGSHGWLWMLAVPIILLLYYISFVTVNRRLDRGWL